jgi:tRNA threonylcarbamoyladenosine biosynthesis protein TsaE
MDSRDSNSPEELAQFFLESESATDAWGATLAGLLPRRCCLGLTGTLGAGKTRFVQSLASARGIPRRQVTSPTFTLVQVYAADPLIYHLDAYRIASENEFLELGVEEFLADEVWTVIEWGDKFANLLPRESLWVEWELLWDEVATIELASSKGVSSTQRRVRLRGLRDQWNPLVEALSFGT